MSHGACDQTEGGPDRIQEAAVATGRQQVTLIFNLFTKPFRPSTFCHLNRLQWFPLVKCEAASLFQACDSYAPAYFQLGVYYSEAVSL